MNTWENYPKYLVRVNGQLKFLPLREAQEAWDWPYAQVEIEQLVLEAGDMVREITEEEKKTIQNGISVRPRVG